MNGKAIPHHKDSRGPVRNAQPWLTGLVGLGVFVAAFQMAATRPWLATEAGFFAVCGMMFAAMVVVDLAIFKVHRQPDVGTVGQRLYTTPDRIRTLGLKLLAFGASMAIAGGVYLLVPIYSDPWFTNVFDTTAHAAGIFLAGAQIYVIAFHFVTDDPADGLSTFGLFLFTFGRIGNRQDVNAYLLGLMIKVFFLPLMIGFALQDWTRLAAAPIGEDGFRSYYEFLYQFFLLIDVSFAVIGYSCSFRFLNAHVRWPELSLGGWLVCLICYAPFWQIINRNYISYSDGIVWGNVFDQNGPGYVIWGTLILVLMGTYALSTVSFGYRFSNLTYRGVVTHGPYRVFRHPAYTCKNMAYWMIELPFLGSSPSIAFANCIGLFCINLIYVLRARFEEKCCSRHEDYIAYRDTPFFIVMMNGITCRLTKANSISRKVV